MKAVIFDLDGTLADCSHRTHFVKHGQKNWSAFFSGIKDDPVVGPIRMLLHAVREHGNKVILCSGRPESCRDETEKWLETGGVWADAHYSKLYMRPDNDTRPDHVVKAELLVQMKADGFEPFMAIDDRASIVKLWRDNGIYTLQCAADADFDGAKATAKLTLMVGPSGAGKTQWLTFRQDGLSGYLPRWIVSSDKLREDLCRGDFKDQSKNAEVFEALHDLVRTRLRHGLPTVVDATNIKRKDRLSIVDLAPPGCPITYVVIDRPLEEKRRTGGWRNELGDFDLIGKHHQTFQSNLKDILSGDGLPNVSVVDLRQSAVKIAA